MEANQRQVGLQAMFEEGCEGMTLDIKEMERQFQWTKAESPQFPDASEFYSYAEDHWPAIIAALREGERLREAIETIRLKLEQIVCVVEPDDGVVLLSNEGPTHWDDEFNCQVYDHLHFSPLGDALIELHKIAVAARKQLRE